MIDHGSGLYTIYMHASALYVKKDAIVVRPIATTSSVTVIPDSIPRKNSPFPLPFLLLKALDDPYSEYYTAVELKEMLDQSQGIYYGIGAYVQLDKSIRNLDIRHVILQHGRFYSRGFHLPPGQGQLLIIPL